MTTDDSVFQLSEAWFTLGVVTPQRLEAMRSEWARGEDPYPEHYRWRAFVAFLAERRPLEAQLAVALYRLGERDADEAMGSAMMHRIVELPECPQEILVAAAASGRRDLMRSSSNVVRSRRLAADRRSRDDRGG